MLRVLAQPCSCLLLIMKIRHQEESGREKAAWHQAAKSLETLRTKVRHIEPSSGL